MGDTHHRNHHQDAAEATSSKFGPRKMGEIVEVQGGHIVRATGRKDRHSKVCTAKGPRDRRVRLSAHTAIQFYDVQDRLGYDRPSKAVDWLIKKAKAAIDELAELPPWSPTTATAAAGKSRARSAKQDHDIGDYGLPVEGSRRRTMVETTEEMVHMTGNANANPNDNDSGFLPPSLDSDAIADTIKSFFPVGASAVTSSSPSPVPFYPPDLLSRTSSQSQDLRLSLQSFREPILLNPHHHHAHAQEEQQVLFSGDGAGGHHLGFDGWPDHPHQQHQAEINRFQRMIAWNNNAGDACSGDGGGGFIFNHQPPPSPPPQPFFGQNQFFTQRGPLQSSNTPSFRAWIDPVIVADQHQLHHIPQIHQQPLISGMEFAAAPGGVFSGFRVPARIQGHVEEHDGIHNKPSSASSASRH